MTLIDGDYDDDNDNSEDDIHAIHFISPKIIFKNKEMAMRMMILMQLPCNN